MRTVEWYVTTEKLPWKKKRYIPVGEPCRTEIMIDGGEDQVILGFGGCFNELGGIALQKLADKERADLMDALFGQDMDGLRLNYNRMPLGASDFASRWYSYDEVPGDYGMEHFSIDGDRRFLLPYIKAAYSRNKNMRLFGSPWSPPAWMKTPPVYNFGRLTQTEEVLRAYALYFKKYVEAYAGEGIHIDQLCVQNEIFADQKFPSCLWSSDQLYEFITCYLGPLFEKEGIDTEILLGTLNGNEAIYHSYPSRFFHDPIADRYVKGAAFQWSGKYAINMTHESFPEKLLIQSENECGNGDNDWEYAKYVYGLLRHYLTYGANAYVYWNMVLEEGGMSTWGWRQNAMVTVTKDQKVHYNHEYYIMKHFSRYIKPGAVRLRLKGHFTANSTAFRNQDGSLVLTVLNAFPHEITLAVSENGRIFTFALEPDSVHTIVLGSE